MSTLLIYYSEDEQIRDLCKNTYGHNTDTFEIREYFDRSPAYVKTIGSYLAITGKNTAIEKNKPDLQQYDTIIIASPIWAQNPAPAVNAFLRANNLKGKEVIGLLFSGSGSLAFANDVLRKRILLAGGICKSVVTIPKKSLIENNMSIVSLALQKAA